jgi:hypothetical protein
MKMAFEELVEKVGFVVAVVVANKLSEEGFLNCLSFERLSELCRYGDSFDGGVKDLLLEARFNRAESFEDWEEIYLYSASDDKKRVAVKKMFEKANSFDQWEFLASDEGNNYKEVAFKKIVELAESLEQLTTAFNVKTTSWRQWIQKKSIWKKIFKKAETIVQLKEVYSDLACRSERYAKLVLKEISKRDYTFDQWKEFRGSRHEITGVALEKMFEKAKTKCELFYLLDELPDKDMRREAVLMRIYKKAETPADCFEVYTKLYDESSFKQQVLERLLTMAESLDNLRWLYNSRSSDAKEMERVLKEIDSRDFSFELWCDDYRITEGSEPIGVLIQRKIIEKAKTYEQLQKLYALNISESRQVVSKKMAELAETLDQCIEVCNHERYCKHSGSRQIVMAKMSKLLEQQ